MVDPDKRDRAVAFIAADANRLHLVRTLEKRSEPLTFEFLCARFYTLTAGEIYALLNDLESKEIISKMSEGPASWDLTTFGHEILYALEPRAHTSKFSFGRIIHRLTERKKNKKENSKP